MTTIHRSLAAPDLSCGHCVTTITKALAGLPGLRACQVDLGRKRVEIEVSDPAVVAQAQERLSVAGYPTHVIADRS